VTPPLTTYEDKTLIEMTLAGRSECFVVLMDRHLFAVKRMIRTMVGNQSDTDDLIQEVLFKAWHRLSTFRAEASFRTWMTRVAINEVLQSYRRQKYHSCCEAPENLDCLVSVYESPHQSLCRAETSRTVHKALSKLPEKYRQVLILHEFEQLSMRETARSLHATVPAVKSRLFRARLLLSSALKKPKAPALAA
jgi:RNA polymerase sigma-70 factor, ECF subfamily